MRFQCPFCTFLVEARDEDKGLTAQCPSCENTIKIPSSAFEEGCVIGDFVINEKIGTGSIGTVFKAEQLSLERTVALKILSPQYTTKAGIKSFLKEARQAAMLSHPNLVQALAVGSEEKICYMAMNFIRGKTVKDVIQNEGPYPEDEALHIIQQVAEALHYAWVEAGLVHRDVKPENLMITDEGIVKLTDLGLAMPESEWKEGMKISGSPSYMSPEQFAGKKLDCRSDIYSLGVSLYQMLSGDLPFKGDTLRTIAKQHFTEVPTPLHKMRLEVSQDTSRLVLKMMAKKPENRFADHEHLLQSIWKIRQGTAPNKELVPEVHTISINRLDYSKQYSAPLGYIGEKDESIQEVRELQHTNRNLALLLICLTVLVMSGIVWGIFATEYNDPKLETLIQHTRDLKQQLADGKNNPDDVRRKAAELIGSMRDKRSPDEEMLMLELKLLSYEAEVIKLRRQVAKLNGMLKNLNNKVAAQGTEKP